MHSIVHADPEPWKRRAYRSSPSWTECMCEFIVYSESRNCKGSFRRVFFFFRRDSKCSASILNSLLSIILLQPRYGIDAKRAQKLDKVTHLHQKGNSFPVRQEDGRCHHYLTMLGIPQEGGRWCHHHLTLRILRTWSCILETTHGCPPFSMGDTSQDTQQIPNLCVLLDSPWTIFHIQILMTNVHYFT